MNEMLKMKQKQRIAFLNKLYDLSDGSTSNPINGAEIAGQIGLSDGNILTDIAKYLKNEGLIKVTVQIRGFPASVQLTHSGLKEIEEVLDNPNNSTEHFMPVNILHVENMIGSNIQQGSVNSNQSLSFNNEVKAELAEFLNKLKHEIPNLSLDNEYSQELQAEINTAEAQLTSPKPKVSILSECLTSIQRILEATTGSAIGGHLATQIPALLSLFV
jgi:DNA-binding PadR family transcriptional regulator